MIRIPSSGRRPPAICWMSLVAAIAVVCLSAAGAQSNGAAAAALTGKIVTVTGPISPDAAGLTLMHEHIFIDYTTPSETPESWAATGRTRPVGATAVKMYNAPLTMDILGAVKVGAPNRDNWLLGDEKVAIDEVTEFSRFGGRTIVDVTSIGLKRDPQALRRVAQATGVQIVMGSSWYERAWTGDVLASRTVESLTDEIVRDITVGVGTTGIRSGIIGEVGTDDVSVPDERKLLQASARASRITGAPISIHISRGKREQVKVLDILAADGVDLSRVAMGHSNPIANNMPLLLQIVKRGAYVQFDLLGDFPYVQMEMSDHDVAAAIVELIKQGFVERILLSQDVCMKTDLKAYGGSGYSFIPEYFLPYLKRLGVTDAQIETIVIGNPKRLLTFAAPQAPTASASSR